MTNPQTDALRLKSTQATPGSTGLVGDFITCVRSPGHRLAKLIRADGHIAHYDKSRRFDLIEQPIADLAALANVLRAVLHRRDIAIVRGEIADRRRVRQVRRLLHRDVRTGEAPTLRDVPRRWVALDVEGTAQPRGIAPSDLLACYRVAILDLPKAFQSAACIIQATGSHGFRPDMRLRLWFWSDRRVGGVELKRWLYGTPADPSVFGAAQLIFTAAPIVADGCIDPIADRLLFVSGEPLISPPVTAAPDPHGHASGLLIRDRNATAKNAGDAPLDRYVHRALTRAAANIMVADKRHPVIIRECASLARLVHAGLLTESDLRATVTAAARRAGKEDLDEVELCIAWGLSRLQVKTQWETIDGRR